MKLCFPFLKLVVIACLHSLHSCSQHLLSLMDLDFIFAKKKNYSGKTRLTPTTECGVEDLFQGRKTLFPHVRSRMKSKMVGMLVCCRKKKTYSLLEKCISPLLHKEGWLIFVVVIVLLLARYL